MMRNGKFHSALRSLWPSKLGALLLHLPAAWPRLEYLLQVRVLEGLGRSGGARVTKWERQNTVFSIPQ